jgi:pimeloyl-ACP methyl ester carboxylesterase
VPIHRVSVSGDLPVLALAGARGQERIVFLHGMCSKPDAYLRSFRFAAASVGRTVALQGDSECSGPRGDGRTWSRDIDRLDRRIEKAWEAIGEMRPLRDLIVIGYSLGAVRAEALAKLNPDRYSQLVLIGGPKRPAVRGLRELEAAVMVAGERDRQAPMKAGQRELEAIGVPAIFLPLPEAAHGEMGPDAERVMSRAFEFLRSNDG